MATKSFLAVQYFCPFPQNLCYRTGNTLRVVAGGPRQTMETPREIQLKSFQTRLLEREAAASAQGRAGDSLPREKARIQDVPYLMR